MPGALRDNRKFAHCCFVEFVSSELFLLCVVRMFLGCILFTLQFDEKNTKICSPSSFLEEKKAHSITVFGIETKREEHRCYRKRQELFLERGVELQKHIRFVSNCCIRWEKKVDQ
ncbi:hypothetical protein CEXT_104801 [Caerostris extrusa]|uniref:Uncharacterized protein n=1 Tax=Caerostris extrusa TaxID=172846 RepID=A0AAV4XTQ1_CAEEX|nr:hypothetical protein CEXT_104801 [Caerostris extrusa]